MQRAAAALVVVAAIADRRRIGRCHDVEVLLAADLAKIDRDDDAEQVANLVRQFDQQLLRAFHVDDLALVVAPDDQHPALGIGEAADPAQELVPPGFLPFGVLVLFHGSTGPDGLAFKYASPWGVSRYR